MNSRDEMILRKIISYCEEIRKTHVYFDYNEKFFKDKENGYIYRNSITMPILQIGELAKNLSDDMRNESSSISWREIMGMRDVFAHHYGSLDFDIVWLTSTTEIVDLEEKVSGIIKE